MNNKRENSFAEVRSRKYFKRTRKKKNTNFKYKIQIIKGRHYYVYITDYRRRKMHE